MAEIKQTNKMNVNIKKKNPKNRHGNRRDVFQSSFRFEVTLCDLVGRVSHLR